ncbi:MAG: AAA family ATPase [Candidatus Thiodiazotropha taylori]|nr:AAA family ATPase [Candidatus Thiodiazotropha taylori]MCG8111583.1 AAA family ATPase [Candidatus Thiodiazotropha taylori]MCW4283939.1 AAA family ATPase [Candidatus Thiodiazotropha taylori]MCW4306445.1 AAA family ATPase [Candidatus Thiodiazotropha taylori]
MPEAHDIENIKAIGRNLDEINNALQFYERPYAVYEPLELLSEIEKSDSFVYRIVDRELENPRKDTGAYGFLRYLNDFFIFMRVASKVPDLVLSAPIFFFSSERALTKGFEVQAGQLTEDTYLSGYQSAFNAATGQTNLLQWGSQHFVRLYRRSLWKAGTSTSHFQDFLRKEPDVILLDKYLGMLGYGWDLEHDEELTKFRLGLKRGGMTFFSEIFSSGEREIIHFLVSMFALNVRDGLILVDEPELHLHPRWQRMFLRLFKELAPERNNQFIIATHSPVFISPDTIQNVIRTYRKPNEGSYKVALRDMEGLPAKKQLVRMINSQNNERLFFADKVILVEGITDRIVINSLVERALEYFKDSRSVEVIDVGGKHNFLEYQRLLDGLQTPWAVVADRDYLEQIGSNGVKGLFVIDKKSQAKSILDDKKSRDRDTLINSLRQYLENEDKDSIFGFLEYLDSRHKLLKSDLTREERALLETEFSRLSNQGIELLRYGGGEIEDYMPSRLTDIGDVIEMVSKINWIIDIDDEETRVHLGSLLGRILDVDGEQLGRFIESIRQRNEVFEIQR